MGVCGYVSRRSSPRDRRTEDSRNLSSPVTESPFPPWKTSRFISGTILTVDTRNSRRVTAYGSRRTLTLPLGRYILSYFNFSIVSYVAR